MRELLALPALVPPNCAQCHCERCRTRRRLWTEVLTGLEAEMSDSLANNVQRA